MGKDLMQMQEDLKKKEVDNRLSRLQIDLMKAELELNKQELARCTAMEGQFKALKQLAIEYGDTKKRDQREKTLQKIYAAREKYVSREDKLERDIMDAERFIIELNKNNHEELQALHAIQKKIQDADH